MNIFKSVARQLRSSVMGVGKRTKKVSLLSELKNHPENFKLEAYIENDEVIVKIKHR